MTPYIATRRPKSVLCTPIISQSKLVGILYLENNLANNVFTAQRCALLNVICTQAAISIENAILYRRQERMSESMQRFVPHNFLNSLDRTSIIEVELGDNIQKELSVLFSDIVGFTPLVEGLSPQEAIGFINEYLSYMEPAILAHGGFVDSYIGDAILALFDTEADAAVAAAVDMHRSLVKLNGERVTQDLMPIRMGIGINTGRLTLGTIGGPNRLKCGVIGDSVNLAARVESLTRRYRAQLIISDHTRDAMRDPSAFQLRSIDRVRVVGKTEPVELFEVMDADPDERLAAKLRMAEPWNQALDHYYRREFSEAHALLEVCREILHDDAATEVFLERCERYRAEGVPDTWDGVENLRTK
jgi:class 3 adenylate cyclase